MNNASLNNLNFRFRLEPKKTKDMEKDDQLKEITKDLNTEFEHYLSTSRLKPTKWPKLPKLQSLLNELLHKNSCKLKQIADLESQISIIQKSHHSSSLPSIDHPQLRIKELNSELDSVNLNTEQENIESLLLENLKQKEKQKLRIAVEKTTSLESSRSELKKYSEKLLMTTSMAGNLFESASKQLLTSKKNIFSQKHHRRSSLGELKDKKNKLKDQLVNIESNFANKLYNTSMLKTRLSFISNKIEALAFNTFETKNETSMALALIKVDQNRLFSVIKQSKFLVEVIPEDIKLENVGKYFNILVFSESQLQLRFDELIKSQKSNKHKIELLRIECEAMKARFSDSEFIEKWNNKLYAESKLPKNKPSPMIKQAFNLEKASIACFKGLADIQTHFVKLVEEINSRTQDPNPRVKNPESLIRKRTFSFRHSFNTLPVLVEQKNVSSFYRFRDSVTYLMNEKFKNDKKSTEMFLKVLTDDYILKNFLNSGDIGLFINSLNDPEHTYLKYYQLYLPAHDNFRMKISKIVRYSISFLTGIVNMSNQVMDKFDKNILTSIQIDKLMALNPHIEYSSRHLKDIVKDVLRYSELNHRSFQGILRLEKSKNAKEFGVINEEPEEELIDTREKKPQSNLRHHRCQSQQEIKAHINDLNSLVARSSRGSHI